MTSSPSFDEIFAVMAAASNGDASRRVNVPDDSDLEQPAVRLAGALNVLLDDLAFREAATHRMAERLGLLADASREFAAAAHDHQQLLQVVAGQLSQLGGDLCVIRTLNETGLAFEQGGALCHPNPEVAAAARELLSVPFQLSDGFTGRVATTGQPLLIPRLTPADLAVSTVPQLGRFLERLGVTGLVAVPLKARARVIGVATLLRSDRERTLTQDDLRLLESIAEHASIAMASSRAHAAERAAEANYRVMFENSPEPMFVFDPDSLRFLEVNEASIRQYGYLRGEFLSMTLSDIWPAEDVVRNRDAVARNPLATSSATLRHRKKDGTVCDVEVRAHAVPFGGRECRLVLVNDITDRLRAEQGRKAAEARFTWLAESGIIGIVVGGMDGKIIEANQAVADMLGYTRADIISGSVRWPDLTPPEWRIDDDRTRAELRADGVASLREKEYIHRDGSRIPVLIGAAMLRGGVEEGVIAFVLDLRGSRRLEVAIEHLREARASEATFRGYVEAAPDAVVIVDAQGKIVLVNALAERLFGYSRAELLGQATETLVPARLRDRHFTHRGQYSEAPRAREMGSGLDLYGLRKDGTEFPIEVSLGPIQTDAGPLFASAIRDITERKSSDEQRYRLAAIVNASDDAIIGMTIDGVITSWNDGAQRLFGYSQEESLGRAILFLVPPDCVSEEEAILQRVASGAVERFESVRVRKDGEHVHVSITNSPIRDSDGLPIGVSKVVRDITERRRGDVALARAKDTAESASRELEAFSYSVAHDLRAPLRGMNGFAQLLLNDYQDKLGSDGNDWLQEILLNAGKMAALIDALLSLARLTRSELHRELIDLSVLVREIGGHLSAAEPSRSVDLEVEPALSAEVDPVLARALLENLLANAWKFTSKTPRPRVAFGATQHQGSRSFYVRDNGAGFDMAFASKLFAPFQRLHSADEFPGTGIGLATVQRIVHRHGGRICAEGSVAQGATFYFTFSARPLEGAPS